MEQTEVSAVIHFKNVIKSPKNNDFSFFKPYVLRLTNPMKALDSSGYFADFLEDLEAGKEWFSEQHYINVHTRSEDGIKLHGYFLKAENARGTVMLVHGFHGDGVNDFASAYRYIYELGFNLLIIDQRAHGKSEGKYITFGIKERYDVRSWVQFLNEKLGDDFPIFIYGVSMGCTCVLMATSLGLPPNVKGIVADCGFTNPKDMYVHLLTTRVHAPCFPILPISNVLTKTLAGFDIDEYSTLDAIKNNTIPTIFIHGEADDLVPFSMTQANYEMCKGEKYIFTTPDALHCMSYLMEPDKYNKILGKF